ncbi:hypothetical protein ACIBP6_39020 [Nonomuraea terrae]|uniref:hypothetical protein n=1 Tax=Nonomuraea terrae TaxID=2530383 RepID=UPI0037B2F4D5
MSPNEERDWFAPKHERRPEDYPPPPPSPTPPPGLGASPRHASRPPQHPSGPNPPEHAGQPMPPETRGPVGSRPPEHAGRPMTPEPPDGPEGPGRPMTHEQWRVAHEQRQAFRGQPMPRRRDIPLTRPQHNRPDQQVWPPAPREPAGGETQPMPAVNPSAGMLPTTPSGRHSAGGPPAPGPRPAAAGPQPAPPGAAGPQPAPPGVGGPLPVAPGAGAPPATPPGAVHASGALPPGGRPGTQEHVVEAPQPAGERPRPGKRRTALVAVGAVVVSLLTTAAQTYDGYLFYDKMTTKATKETVVAAGQAGRVRGIEWTAKVTPTDPPEGSKPRPGVTWLTVDITKKVVDEGSATKTAGPNDVRLEDRAGRTWTVETQEVGDTPTDRLVVGRPYRIQGLAVVPTPVKDEVELTFRPSNYRSDTPTEDLFSREGVAKLEEDVDVLRFRRR